MNFHNKISILTTVILTATIAGAWAAPNEKQALAVLNASDSSLEAKANACTDLSVVGTAKAVPALAKLLSDKQLTDYVRNALELIPDAAAGEALLAAASELKGDLLIGVVITLGDRGDEAAVPVLQKLATDSECCAADAALSSLALIANDQAAETIIAVLKEGKGDLKVAAAHAALRAAERRKAAGKDSSALLAAVKAADVPAQIKAAAK
jgi:HEAT repeat protein